MGMSNMKESKSNEIVLKDADLETVKNLLFFMYTGKIDNEKVNVSLLAAVDLYEVLSLRHICIQELSKAVKYDNVMEIWQAGILLNIEELVEPSTVFMVQNWSILCIKD